MAKNLGWIRNPLTIIGIFSTLTEGLCIVILPHVTENNQSIFIWFVILFPTILLILFFYTLINHNTKLYAPGDFSEDKLEFAALFLNKELNNVDTSPTILKEKKLEQRDESFVPFVFSEIEGNYLAFVNAANNFFIKLDQAIPKERFDQIVYELHNTVSYSLVFIIKDEYIVSAKVKTFSITIFQIEQLTITIGGSGLGENTDEARIKYIISELDRITTK